MTLRLFLIKKRMKKRLFFSTKRNIEFVEQSYLISSPFAIYGPTITVTQLSNLSTWAFPVFYKNILD